MFASTGVCIPSARNAYASTPPAPPFHFPSVAGPRPFHQRPRMFASSPPASLPPRVRVLSTSIRVPSATHPGPLRHAPTSPPSCIRVPSTDIPLSLFRVPFMDVWFPTRGSGHIACNLPLPLAHGGAVGMVVQRRGVQRPVHPILSIGARASGGPGKGLFIVKIFFFVKESCRYRSTGT